MPNIFNRFRDFMERDIEWSTPTPFWGRKHPWMSAGSIELKIANSYKASKEAFSRGWSAAGLSRVGRFRTLGAAGAGTLLGASMGGAPGAILGTLAGTAFGAFGPVDITKRIWKSGPLGKAGLIGAGSLAAGAMMFGGPGIDPETFLGTAAGAVTLAATISTPLAAVGFTGGLIAAAKGGGLKGFGAAMGGRWGAGAVRKTAHLAARSPVKMAGLLGMTMGLWSLGKGLVDIGMDNRNAIGSMAAGSIEGRYGMDPNNLDTQGLTLALHYRHM